MTRQLWPIAVRQTDNAVDVEVLPGLLDGKIDELAYQCIFARFDESRPRALLVTESSNAYGAFIRLCHRASKLSGSAGASACESNGDPLGFSGSASASSSTVVNGTCAGHSNNAFESPGAP